MKISRILFISYFSLFGLVLLSFLVFGFAYKDKESNYCNSVENIEQRIIELNEFKYIVQSEGTHVIVKSDSLSRLVYSEFNNRPELKPSFKISHDTLYVYKSSNNLSNGITIISDDLNFIKGENCRVELFGINQTDFKIIANKTNVNFHGNTHIKNLELTLHNNSEFSGWQYSIQSLKLDVDNSKFWVNHNIVLNSIQGKVSNCSNFQVPKSHNYNLKIDEATSFN